MNYYFGSKDGSYEWKPDKQPYLAPVFAQKQSVGVCLCCSNQYCIKTQTHRSRALCLDSCLVL